MKKILILLTLCAFAFGASECDRKIDHINKEISFSKAHNDTARTLSLELALKQVQNDCAKDPMFYDKKLEAKKLKEQEVEKIEKELDALKEQKDYMSKAEYKAKKEALKEQKEKIKKEIKEYIDNL
ncbi:DUF1090 family protein [Campylobacter jejuni]|uniref:DUF1090 family protein n=1 Tax=Campylobacter TaxID=194 RepID=UPI000444AC00|nr:MULTISPECIES: DUF1090 family protein [Campylobacter]AHW92416.1 hypothetical protein H730_07985 [Campylobacter jejuni subsp. jejuni R14]AYA32820.1 DUF1090 family protein [Campylobacter jejuni subsp. jejuni]EAC1383569.1 DUF1090 family protein [Campylobacter jejuni]EAC1831685.1 DUF1090 family protein [Campylobacter jejuni]EAH5025664.1 DUF1090 family protein [Campylobacter jejuni]